MAEKPKIDPYAIDNLRFRKAYVRERLSALKNERDALIAERTVIDEQLAAQRSPKKSEAEAHAGA